MDKATEKALGTFFNIAWERPREKTLDYNANCAKWLRVAKEHIVTDFPMHLDIEVCSSCNLKCPMCMRKQLSLPNEEMNFRLFVKIMDEASQYPDFEAVKPNFRNEPTLARKLPEMLQYLHQMKQVKEVIMNTNGNYALSLNDKIAPYLSEIAFSIDAVNYDTYKQVRPGGNLDRVELNVRRMVHLRDRTLQDLRVRVAFVVQEENMDEADEFLEKWKRINVDKVAVSECYNPQGKGEDRARVEWVQRESYCCPQLYQRLVILYNGTVVPCCGAYDESLSLGNIFKGDSLYDIWHGEKLENLRAMHEAGQYKDIPTCAKCALTFSPTPRPEQVRVTGK